MLLGIAQVGTLAAWNDDATVQSATFTTGTLDLQVGENSADQLAGQGGTWNHSSLALTDLTPGESVARMLTVGNGGSMPLDHTGSVSTSNGNLSGAGGLELTVTAGATATNTGTHEGNDRVGTCTGGTATAITGMGIGTTATPINSAPITLAPGAATRYCVVATLPPDAPNTMQGKATAVVFTFQAAQR